MLKDITLGQYIPGDSPVHKADPRVKIALSLIFIVIIFFVKSYWGYLAVFLYIALITILSKIKLSYLVKSLRPLLFIIILTFVINIFFTTGTHVILKWKFLVITWEGISQAAVMALRLILLIFGTSILTFTTSPILITDGIEHLLNPLKVFHFPAHEIAMMMTIALRFIPTLLEETDKIMKAQIARGADFESGNLMQRARSLVPLMVPLFISSFRRADELAMAMESRCYKGGEGRTRMRVLKVEKRDYIGIILTAVMVAFIFFDRYFI